MPGEKEYSEKTAETIDKEIKAITGQAYEQAKTLISSNKERLEQIAQALLKYETLEADDVKLIIEGGILDKPTVGDLLAAEQLRTADQQADSDKPENETPNQQ